jgi:hypothetical protein
MRTETDQGKRRNTVVRLEVVLDTVDNKVLSLRRDYQYCIYLLESLRVVLRSSPVQLEIQSS